jgi:hypothetical protein
MGVAVSDYHPSGFTGEACCDRCANAVRTTSNQRNA